MDLGRYIEAHYAGMTPGQQHAAVGMVTGKELAQAKKPAKMLGVEPVVYAMAEKARVLSGLLSCSAKDAWDAMARCRAEVMPYIHQRMPQAPDGAGDKKLASVPIIALADMDDAGDQVLDRYAGEDEDLQGLDGLEPVTVSQPKSHDDAQPQAQQGLALLGPTD